jgi:hypothetical protein
MRQTSENTKNGLDQFTFLEAGEIPGLIEKHKITAGSWHGDTTEEFRKKALLGDNSLVAVSEQFLAMIEDQVPMSRGWRNVDDVVGAIPNVPAFLAGHPQHMRRRVRVAKTSAPLIIYMDLTSSASIDAKTVTKRGIVLLALTRLLVEHRPVELWVGTSKGGYKTSGTVAWRIDTAPLDLARAAYHIGSSAMARGFGYSMDNKLHKTGGHWPFGDYALHCKTAKERLQLQMGHSELLFIPPIHIVDEMVNKPVEWLKRTMAEYVEAA